MIARWHRTAPKLVWLVGALLAVELIAVALSPIVIPTSTHLRGYLSDRSIESTRTFLAGDGILLPDSATGWRNRPNTAARQWSIDSLGSRSARPATWARQRPMRVLALGSSTTNGGMGVTNQETITAFLETDSLEALNFATMLYAADQAYLAWTTRLSGFGPDVVLLGLDAAAERALQSVYVPLRSPDEDNIPFVKPRFVLTGDSLSLLAPDPHALLRDVPNNDALVDFFMAHDAWAWEFSSYRRLGMTPLAASGRALMRRARRQWEARFPDATAIDLLASILKRFQADASAKGARLVVLLYPDANTMASGWRRLLPDDYAERVAQLAARGVAVVDVRALFAASGRPIGDLFHNDGVHFSPMGNQVIADGTRQAIVQLAHDASIARTPRS